MSEVSAWSYSQREQREIHAEIRESTWEVLDPPYPTVTRNGPKAETTLDPFGMSVWATTQVSD